ncbi:MAG: hypothetical protein IJZ53_05095 [Tyzzerella sp.]|nr:hypothetical protein [Tyzzerella sp.]
MDEKKTILRIIMMSIIFILLVVSILFEDMLGATGVGVIRIIAIIIGIIFLGFYNKKLR